MQLTIRVVLADVMRRSLPGPAFGSSTSVIRNTRLEAVFGALEGRVRSMVAFRRNITLTRHA